MTSQPLTRHRPFQTPQNTDLVSCSFFLAIQAAAWLPHFPSAACQFAGPPQYQTLGIVSAVLTCLAVAADTVDLWALPYYWRALSHALLSSMLSGHFPPLFWAGIFRLIFLFKNISFFKLQCVCARVCVLKHVYPIAHMEVREQLTRVYSLLPPLGIGFLNWTQVIKPGSKHLHPLNHLTDPTYLFFFPLNVIINYSLVRIFLSYY